MDIIEKKNLEVPSTELEEINNEHTVECVPQTILNSGDSDSEDPEEDPGEDPEDNPEVKLAEDLEKETEEKLEEGSKVEYEEDPEEDSSEEPEEQSDVECVTTSLSCHKTIASELLIEDPDEDPSEEYLSEPYSENDPEEIVEQEGDFGYAAAALHSKSEMPGAVVGDDSGSGRQDNTGSGKRRRSRWDQEREDDRETVEGDRKVKKRKTRWDTDDSRLKFLVINPDLQGLKSRLAEINSKLERSEVHDDRPGAERSPSPQPVYNNLGIRINTREVRLRNKLIQERQRIISKLTKTNPTFKTSKHNYLRYCKKLYIPVEEYPTYNFIGLILGPKGNTQKRMEKETGATIQLRGKGSKKTSLKADPSDDENLHVLIGAGSRKSLNTAVSMVKKLLIPPPEEGMSDHKRAQLQELEKLKQENLMTSCSVCKDPRHNHYACPHKKSTLKTSCYTCGSFCHPTSGCLLTSSPQGSNPPQNSSRLDFGSAPNTEGKFHKEISSANLYVGYLPRDVNDSRLRELFSPFGTITQSRVARDHTTGLSKCHGFVRFHTPTAAALAISHMNGHQIDGHTLAVRVAGPPTTGSSSMNLLPAYPGPLAAFPGVPSWQGPPQYMLPEAQVSFPNGEGLGLPRPSSVYLEHKSQFSQTGATVIPPVFSSGTIKSNSKTAFSVPGSGAMFPGDPDYSSGSAAMFPGDPDYPGGSEFQSYFSTRTL